MRDLDKEPNAAPHSGEAGKWFIATNGRQVQDAGHAAELVRIEISNILGGAMTGPAHTLEAVAQFLEAAQPQEAPSEPIGYILPDSINVLREGNDVDLLCDNSVRQRTIPVFIKPQAAPSGLSDADIDMRLDAVLRSSGSALRHYSMQKSLDDMRTAMRWALTAPQTGSGS